MSTGVTRKVLLPRVNIVKTGENITRLRKEAGLSVRDLQKILGFGGVQSIYKWQSGFSIPTIDNLVILGAIFKVPIDEIIAIDWVDMGEEYYG